MAAGSALMMSAPGVMASAKGDVWTQPFNQAEETPKGHSQEVHLPCNSVDIWGDKLDAVTNQAWSLFHLPPPNPPGPGTLVATGTYSTDGSRQKIGVIDKSVFTTAPGPHFKVEVYNNGDKKSKTFWVECGPVAPTFFTTPQPETAALGTLLKDTATIEGNLPTGTIAFTLYDPSNVAVHTEDVTVDDDGTYATAQGHVADVAGGWHWTAHYSGDTRNSAATSLDEPVTVNKADPSLTTTQDPAAGLVGITLKDGATLSHGYNPTGTITFYLNDPDGNNAFHKTVNVNGNGTYSTQDGFTALHAGTWQWYAVYSGDTNNNARRTAVGDEPVVVTSEPVTPHITTTQLPDSAKVGDVLKDKATLTGTNNATGTITFELFDSNGHSLFHESVTVSASHSEYTTPNGFMASAPGTFYWVATYNGDHNNNRVSSGTHDEPVTVGKADPSLTTLQNPASALVGTTLQDSGTLAGGYHPTGSITFFLNDPSGTNVYHETVTVTDGNGTYSTPQGYAATTAGTWQWWAEYNGDGNNNKVHTVVGAEPVEISAHLVTPKISTTQLPDTAKVGDLLKDKATLTGASDPTGTITFELFGPNGHSAFHETVTVSKFHTEYTTPTGFTANAAGTWYWVATFSGDANNAGVSSGAEDEPVTVGKADPSITTSQNPASAFLGATLQDSATLTVGYHPTGTITFYLNDPNGTSVYHETVDVTNGNGTYATAHGFAVNAIGAWHWWAEYNGDANNNKVHSVAADEPVVITEGSQPTTPRITTTPVPASGLVGATLHDKATLAGADNPTGSITFTLYSPAGVAVHTETVTVNGNGTYSTIDGHSATLPNLADAIGVWHWKAAYSGDQHNAAVASNAADEPVTIAGGEVLAATAMTNPLQSMALGLIGVGLIALMGALAVRRREA